MRLWGIHPRYLDAAGLVPLWREALLAQKVLKGQTRAYKSHPQLKRFKNNPNPEGAIANYLIEVWEESKRRGYNFDKGKIGRRSSVEKIPVTRDELRHEFSCLCNKLKSRDPAKYRELLSVRETECHPLFEIIERLKGTKTRGFTPDGKMFSVCRGQFVIQKMKSRATEVPRTLYRLRLSA